MPTIRVLAKLPVTRSSTSSSAKSRSSSRKPIRRALIVGIVYKNRAKEELRTPHNDARAWRHLMLEKYKYRESEITMMLDEEGGDSRLIPTRENLLREISALVSDAQAGDKFMFYYTGHSQQFPTKSMSEEDGFDEAIVPFAHTGEPAPILDNDLRNLLVDPLPVGSSLTAIFDSCHSGTMLDLDHYLCNMVYFPWCNKGTRDARFKTRAAVVRRNAVDDDIFKLDLKLGKTRSGDDTNGAKVDKADTKHDVRIYERKRKSKDVLLKRQIVVDGIPPGEKGERRFVVTRSSTMEVSRRGSFMEDRKPRRVFSFHNFTFKDFFIRRCSEPESIFECDGWKCKPTKRKTKAHVISISACQDPQRTWESKSGWTMTQSMIAELNKNPFPPIRKLINLVGHDLHRQTTLKLHQFGQRRMDKWRAAGSPQEEVPDVEIVNGADPQIGSLNVLPEGEQFSP